MLKDNARTEGNIPVDYSKLLDKRCRGKKDFAAKLLRNLLEDSGPRWLEEAESVVSKGDMARVARVGHSIKGSCKMIYAVSMVRAAMNLEDAGREGSQSWANRALEDLKSAFSETSQWLRQNSQLLE